MMMRRRTKKSVPVLDRVLGQTAPGSRKVPRQLGCFGGGQQRSRALAELVRCDVGRVGREDPARLPDDRPKGPVRGRFPIRKRAAVQSPSPLCLHARGELPRQARLADPRGADQRDELRVEFARGARPRPHQQLELRVAAEKRRRGERALGRSRRGSPSEPRTQRRLLALGEDRLHRLAGDRVRAGGVGRLAEQHSRRRSSGLQPGGGVDRVPHHRELPPARAHRSEDDLSGVHADTDAESAEQRRLLDRAVLDLKRRPHRPLRRRPRGRPGAPNTAIKCIADDLVHGASEALHDLAHLPSCNRPPSSGSPRGRCAPRARWNSGQVGEQDCQPAPLPLLAFADA